MRNLADIVSPARQQLRKTRWIIRNCNRRRKPGPACSRRHDLDNGAAVAFELAASDTRYLSKCGERQGAAARHLAQRRIVKYDVRWKLLTARLGEAPGAQRIPN